MGLELLELFARAHRGSFLLVHLLDEPVSLILQTRKFLFELSAVPVELQQPLVLLRRTRAGQELPEVAQPVRNTHDEGALGARVSETVGNDVRARRSSRATCSA